jgi:LAO/AO transport system kinase
MLEPDLLDSVRSGDRRALARAITAVEGGVEVGEVPPGRRVVGVTGPPGAGKSTLIDSIVGYRRGNGETIGVLAVDPSSPVTGGALLGDRIRMQGHTGDQGVYIRSMAARGHLGGLAVAASGCLDLMHLAGFDHLIVETVGVGQSEVDVMNVADVVVLVIGPSWGDEVQADKAGVIEIADVVVVNKSDRPGAEDVRKALAEAARERGFEIVATNAITGEGVDRLIEVVDRLSPPRSGGRAP